MSTAAPPSSLIYRPDSILDWLNLEKLFARRQPVEVELGSGDGSFLSQYAKLRLDRNFIGVERLLGRLRKLDKKGRRAGLANLRVVRIEAAYFLDYLLPKKSIAALHVYFPDPWPKRRHRRKRLINDQFTESASKILEPGGVVYLRTDDIDYFTQMNQVFRASPGFQPVETPANLAAIVTDFEREFLARGVQTQRAAFRLQS